MTRPPIARAASATPRRGGRARSKPRRRCGDRHRLPARTCRRHRRDGRDGRRQPDGSGRPRHARAARRARRGRLREVEPSGHRRGVEADSEDALSRERGPLAAHEGRVRLLARSGFAVRLHGDLEADAGRARPRSHLHGLRLSERLPRAPERLERTRPRLPVAADLRRRRALGHPLPQGRARISWLLVKASSGGCGEVRDPRLPPLVFFYAFGFLATLAGLALGGIEIGYRIAGTT